MSMLGPSGKPKRIRTNFTSEQLMSLENCFINRQYLTRGVRIQISKELNLSERQVKIWFQNRRMKLKKETQNKSKTTRTNQQNSDESRPSSNESAVSHRSSANDLEIRNNLMKYQSYGFPKESSPQHSSNPEPHIQIACPPQVVVPQFMSSVRNAGLVFDSQPWKPVQCQCIDQPMINPQQPALQYKILSETNPDPQFANDLQAAEIIESLQTETPDLKLLDDLLQNESSSNVAQDVLIDSNGTNFITIKSFFANISNNEPTSALSDSITDEWALNLLHF